MMTVVYPVIFTQTHDEKDTVLIEIPDIEGMTEGYGMADAINMARDYIGCACYEKADEYIKPASLISDIDISKGTFAGDGDSLVSYVDLDLDAYRRKMNTKSVRKNVSIPSWLNEEAERAHINVSRVLQDALMEKLGIAK